MFTHSQISSQFCIFKYGASRRVTSDLNLSDPVIYSSSCHIPLIITQYNSISWMTFVLSTKHVWTCYSLTFRNCVLSTNLGYRCNARKSGVRGGGRASRAAGSVCRYVYLGFGHGSAAWSSYLLCPASVSGVTFFSSVSPLLLLALHSKSSIHSSMNTGNMSRMTIRLRDVCLY